MKQKNKNIKRYYGDGYYGDEVRQMNLFITNDDHDNDDDDDDDDDDDELLLWYGWTMKGV